MTWPWRKEKLEEMWRWPHIFCLNLAGWWAEDGGHNSFLSKYRIFTMLYVLLVVLSMVVGIVKGFAEKDVINNLFTVFAATPGISGVYKMVEVVRHQKKLKSVMEDLNDMLSEVNEPVTRQMMRKRLKKVWMIFFLALLWGSGVTVHWMSRPLLVAIFYQEKSTIVDSWPVYLDTWNQFYFSYGYQIFGILWLGHSYFIYDNIYICTAEIILCHFQILKYRLNNLVLLDLSIENDELTDCIKYHNKILRVCKRLSDATSGVIFGQCIIIVVMLCSGIFLLNNSIGENGNQDMNILEITMNANLFLYFYCWYSNELTLQSTNISTSLYTCDWVNASKSDKQAMSIMMVRTMRPVYFGGLLKINLNTFINILKTTFSYYNFLNAVNEEKRGK